MSSKPPTWKVYAAGLAVYALAGFAFYGLGRLASGWVPMRHTCPATTSSSFTIYHPRHALTTGP